MSIKTVIWDMGGVLVRTEDARPREALAARLGLSRAELELRVFESEAGRRGQLGEIEGRAFWEEAGKRFNLGYDEFMQAFFGGDEFDEELLDAIRKHKGQYKIALLSNAFTDMRRWAAERDGFLEIFDLIVVSAEEGVMKPDPAIYALTLARLGVQPGEAVFIDDAAANVEGARAVGMAAIHFRSRAQALAELSALLEEE
jgi:epoxide hydrolase-like predicted phosphatase